MPSYSSECQLAPPTEKGLPLYEGAMVLVRWGRREEAAKRLAEVERGFPNHPIARAAKMEREKIEANLKKGE